MASLIHKLNIPTGQYDYSNYTDKGDEYRRYFTYCDPTEEDDHGYPVCYEQYYDPSTGQTGDHGDYLVSETLYIDEGVWRVNLSGRKRKVHLYKFDNWYTITKIGDYGHNERFKIEEAGSYILIGDDTYPNDPIPDGLYIIEQEGIPIPIYASTTIDEPIGYDDLKMTMKRNDYHGMGAEVSLGELEFV